MNKTKRYMWYSLGLTLLFVIWLLPGYWNLGFALINGLFLGLVWKEFKLIKKVNFLKTLWLLSLLLGSFLAIRSFWFVRLLSIVSVIILNIVLTALAKKPRAKLSLERLVRTKFSFIGNIFKTWNTTMSEILKVKESGKTGVVKKVILGVTMSIPLILVFGVLFYNADPIFARIIDLIKWPNIELNARWWWNTILTVVFFGAIGGVLRNKLAKGVKRIKWMESITEWNIATSLLEILFIFFGLVQIRYFMATADDLKKLQIIFSEYTRSGYGQMIVASMLAYMVVLKLDFAQRSQLKMGKPESKLTKALIWSMMVEILIFIVAATKRNYIYQSFYGFTEIRLLGFFLSGWLVTMLGLLAYKIVKKQRTDFFTRGIILVTAGSVLFLNWFDIDGTIVKSRPASLDSGIDYGYMTNLSDDAWIGWEKVIAEVENNLKQEKIGSSQEYRNQYNLLYRLTLKKVEIDKMRQNRWNWGGSFNYSNLKSGQFLNLNEERIKADMNQLTGQREIRSAKFQQKVSVELQKNITDVYELIKKNNPGLVLGLPYENEITSYEIRSTVMLRSYSPLVDASADLSTKITDKRCMLDRSYNRQTESSGMSVYVYKLTCWTSAW